MSPEFAYPPPVQRLHLFLFIVLSAVAGCATSSAVTPVPVSEASAESVSLAGYVFVYPEWWHEVDAPALPASVSDEQAVGDIAEEQLGEDTGTRDTWRSAMKLWVAWYVRSGELPVYIGHAYRVGGEFDAAARTFAELHALSQQQGELVEWYDCYLAYSAAVTNTEAGHYDEARRWYRVAAPLHN